jgi:polyphosphate kinase
VSGYEPGSIAGSTRFINREISWLDFADRLLDVASDRTLPLLERARFLAIFAGGMDEFFQVRVAGLKDQVAAGLAKRSPDGMTGGEQLAAIREKAISLVARQSSIYRQELVPSLSKAGVLICDYADLTDEDRQILKQLFFEAIFPVLTPLAVDPGHPFPYISGLSLNLAVIVTDPVTGEERFSRVKVPPNLPRFLQVGDQDAAGGLGVQVPVRFVPLEQVIAAHLEHLFPGMAIGAHYAFRVTRNADLTLEEDEAEDLLSAVEMELRRRRFGRAVRLEIDAAASVEVRDLLVTELELEPGDVYPIDGLVDLGGLWSLVGLDIPELSLPQWTPVVPPVLAPREGESVDIFAVLRERDLLVHHPYDSFSATVEAFIEAAASDPEVLAIKQTLYRTAGDSQIVKSLIRAAESGKQVAALVELKARFDEERNIEWAKALEKAGVHVVYGLVGLKTHGKTALVVRAEDGGIRRYCHIGTGNYNATTARSYEDLGLLSSDPDLGADLTDLFNFLTGYARSSDYRKIVVAPSSLKDRVIDLIEGQAELAERGRIVIKVNGLTHPEVIDALYGASRQGVSIDLIVRGICMLRPGVPGLSETIRVRSIVGRFLEHSRIYCFGSRNLDGDCDQDGERKKEPGLEDGQSGEDGTILIGSADLMERNLENRVEVMVPVADPLLVRRLREVLRLCLADDTWSWELFADGTWKRVSGAKGVSLQRRLMEMTSAREWRR